jgi:hypothetical protein
MNSKYQIFVSSTYNDLEDQRNLVIKAILEMGHIPVGMEMFSAADEEQWSIIKRQIDASDYYVVIMANRYGSVDAAGSSFTEKEYDYAVSKGIPALGFVLEKDAPWPSSHTDTDPTPVAALGLFRDKVKKKHVSFWRTSEDLYGKCAVALMKAFTAYPREGWIRASTATSANMSAELARLSAENAFLRSKLDSQTKDEKREHDDELNRILELLKGNHRPIDVWLKDATGWSQHGKHTLSRIFASIAPELMVEKSTEQLAKFYALAACGIDRNTLRPSWPLPSNTLKEWLADFSSLGLVDPSTRKKPAADTNEYWALTPKGKELLDRLRRTKLNEALATKMPDS